MDPHEDVVRQVFDVALAHTEPPQRMPDVRELGLKEGLKCRRPQERLGQVRKSHRLELGRGGHFRHGKFATTATPSAPDTAGVVQTSMPFRLRPVRVMVAAKSA